VVTVSFGERALLAKPEVSTSEPGSERAWHAVVTVSFGERALLAKPECR
jgi:hypothetical protein